jgi:hypothetical protein
MLCPSYLAEISPPRVRQSLKVLEQFRNAHGCVLGFWARFRPRHRTLYPPFYPHSPFIGYVVPSTRPWRIPPHAQLIAEKIPASPPHLFPPASDAPRYDEARRTLSPLRPRLLSGPVLRLRPSCARPLPLPLPLPNRHMKPVEPSQMNSISATGLCQYSDYVR